MENNERDRKLDQWLDEALSKYSAAEPRFGLEQRVLNRIRGEEKRSRSWNFWRWMPAFGAIAAVIVAAVAVRPMLEKKTVVQPSNEVANYARQAGEGLKSPSTESLPKTSARSTTRQTSQQDVNGTLRDAPPLRRELALVPQKKVLSRGDREPISPSMQADSAQSGETAMDISSGSAIEPSHAGALMPAPPPPVAKVQPSMTGGVLGGAPEKPTPTAQSAVNTNKEDTSKDKSTVLLQVGNPGDMKASEEFSAPLVANGAAPERGYAKPKISPPGDANEMEIQGVKVRVTNGPTMDTQQFPTPVPLSRQEKLALKAGRLLKDSVAQPKSAEITPIEIKDVEIKPLEGPEKEK